MLFKQFFVLIKKDFKLQYKNFSGVCSIFFFCIVILLIFQLALPVDLQNNFAPRIYWITFFFSNNLLFQRNILIERENKVFERVLIAPISRFVLMLSKIWNNFFLCLLLQCLLIPIVAIFFNINFFVNFGQLVLLIIFASLGFCALGTLISAITVELKFKEILFPLLLFPMSIPLLLASIKLIELIISDISLKSDLTGIKILIAFDLIYLIICWIAYEFALD